MRLIDRIYAGMVDRDIRRELEMPDPVCIDANNVYWWIHGKKYKDPSEFCPVAKLPFECIWIEYAPGDVEYGFLMFEGPPGLITAATHVRARGREDGESCRFAGFVEASTRAGLYDVPTLDRLGWAWSDNEPTAGDRGRWALPMSMAAWAAISFFHCKNVAVRAVGPSRQIRRSVARRGGILPRAFGFIEIHRDAARAAAASAQPSHAGAYRPHRVRGSYGFYFGSGHRLFGKHEGLYFRASHYRGGSALESAKRDYRVWGPSEAHRPDCIVKAEE